MENEEEIFKSGVGREVPGTVDREDSKNKGVEESTQLGIFRVQ